MKKGIAHKVILTFCFLLLLCFWAISAQNTFFWDTVQLGSRHASFFYTNGFSSFLLPDEIDSGHIPTFGAYIAVFWKLFGKTLFVSHIAVLPFILGIFWQTKLLVEKFIPKQFVAVSTLLLLLTPTLLGQITLVSPDVPLVFFFLLGTNAVLTNRKLLLTFAIVLLFLTSMRGMMVSVCLFLLDVYTNKLFSRDIKTFFLHLLKRSRIYIPAIIIFIVFNWYHYNAKGWIGYHADSPWAEAFERVDFFGFLKNIVVLFWRLFDYGKIGFFVVGLLLLIIYKKRIYQHKKTKTLLFFSAVLILFLTANMLWAKNLSAHRYLLPIFLILELLVAQLLFSEIVKESLRKLLLGVWLLTIISGSFWIYPPKISQGWDATVAHLPYYTLRKDAIQYLEHANIQIEDVASFFPNLGRFKDIDLIEDERSFSHFSGRNSYVLYANVYNVTDSDLDLISEDYKLIKVFKKHRICVKIYKRKKPA